MNPQPPVPFIDIYSRVPPGTHVPRVVNAIIEIPKGRRNKFEVDKNTGLIKLDRYLYSSSHYSGERGIHFALAALLWALDAVDESGVGRRLGSDRLLQQAVEQ